MIKIMQNGVKWGNGEYTPCFYSMGNKLYNSENCITITARDYESLPAELGEIQNDTDSQTDYFDSDRVTLEPGDKYYDEALAAYKKRVVADSKRYLKHDEKRLQKELESLHPYPATVEYLEEQIAGYKKLIQKYS